VAGSATGGTVGVPSGGGTGGVVDPCGGNCTDANATCSAGGSCDCNNTFINVDNDGNPQTADCKSTVVTTVTATVGITHDACGNLVIKLAGPNTTLITLVSRPGEAETADNGMGGSGDMSNLVATSPITFDDTAPTDAELIGNGNGVVCLETGPCAYNPNRGAASGPDTLAAAFGGSTALGTWRLCVGDAAAAETGTLQSFSVAITTSNHTFNGAVTNLNQAIVDNGYIGTLAPGSATCADIVIQ
jgi:subtilisin-like proprotein convertase family protein